MKVFTSKHAMAIRADSVGVESEGAAIMSTHQGGATVVHVRGPICSEENYFFDSYPAIRARVEAAMARPEPVVVLAINSPGGEVSGCFELARTLRELADASGKKLVAWAGSMACSAAYALATAADVIAVPPSGAVGSVGCIRVVADQVAADRAAGLNFAIVSSGARKLDGNPHAPIDEGALEAFRAEVDDLAAQFFDLVASRRGTSVAAIASLDGAVFTGPKAVAANLADLTCDNLEKLLAMVANGATPAPGAEDKMDKYEEAIAALKALAADGDEKAIAAIKAMEPEEKKDDEPKAEEAADVDAPAPKKDDEEKKDEAAKAVVALAEVRSLRAEIAKKEEAAERSALLASRSDWSAEVRAVMASAPIATVRAAVKSFPKGTSSQGQNAAAIAGARSTAAASRGADEGDPSAMLPDADRAALDAAFGTSKPSAIHMVGNRQILPVMTPAEARAAVAQKAGV
jgi:ClpP class serine protease